MWQRRIERDNDEPEPDIVTQASRTMKLDQPNAAQVRKIKISLHVKLFFRVDTAARQLLVYLPRHRDAAS